MRHNLLVFAVLLLGTSFMLAQIPQRMSYQGRLTDAGGAAVANGNYSLTFALYDTVTAGSNLWTETQPTVAVSGGIFSVSLGSVTPISLPFNKPYWLGISVQGGAELSPRTALTSSPYSAISKAVLGTNNVFTSAGNVGIGTTSPAVPLDVVGNVRTSTDYTYASSQTRYLTVSHAAFTIANTTPAASPHRSLSGAPYILRTQGGVLGTLCYFVAPVSLPNGATVASIDAWFYDADAAYNASMTLQRQLWNSSINNSLVTVTTTGATGQQAASSSTITTPVVDNPTYAYLLVFQTTEANLNLGLYNVKITYTVSQSD